MGCEVCCSAGVDELMPLVMTHPEVEGHEVMMESTTFAERILIRCTCGEVMDINEGPSGPALLKTIAAINDHFALFGGREITVEGIGLVMNIAEEFDLKWGGSSRDA